MIVQTISTKLLLIFCSMIMIGPFWLLMKIVTTLNFPSYNPATNGLLFLLAGYIGWAWRAEGFGKRDFISMSFPLLINAVVYALHPIPANYLIVHIFTPSASLLAGYTLKSIIIWLDEDYLVGLDEDDTR